MDKVEKIQSYLKCLKETTASDLQSIVGRKHFKNTITHIDSLLTGCIDNDDVIVLYDRGQLDDWKSQFTNQPATYEEWNNFRNHRDIDRAIDNASEYLNDVENCVIDEERYL